ncbi:unnamed protein product [Microthlaspi erraticum]|uniref:RING-type domain-containing protein n=1 Tax=Microthlaspi erraticum TaxID=1685480 RepID=A0A6D2KXV1_9BRAS|nr:unnamed protein product [Microthlaspi erraticum]CAA7061847.1 unnamed protein product [Microthlaspi erraticum]
MGFDLECIPDLALLPGEFFCPVCHLLVHPHEALQSLCTHLFCPRCLAFVASTTRACPYDGSLVTEADAEPLVQSNRELAETIGETLVFCPYLMSGCTWMGSLSAVRSHCSRCVFGFRLGECTVCHTQMTHRQAEEHAQVCPGIQVELQMIPQAQWYPPQQHQMYYQNGTWYYYMHQPDDVPNQYQVPDVLPEIPYVAEAHSPLRAQPQHLSLTLALHQPHDVSPSASLPQALNHFGEGPSHSRQPDPQSPHVPSPPQSPPSPQANQSRLSLNGVNDVNHAVEATAKSRHELKGKRVMEEGVDFKSKSCGLGILGFTYHGFFRDGGSSSGDMGPNPNPRKRAVEPEEGLDLDSQTKEPEQESTDTVLETNPNAKKLKKTHAGDSPCINPKEDEESGSGGAGGGGGASGSVGGGGAVDPEV